MNIPSISIIIPTLNSSKTLEDCLESIKIQNYPKDKIELIIADGGSRDSTLDIVNKYKSNFKVNIVENKLKTGEAGKAVGTKYAKNDIIALIDSDNILPKANWLQLMAEPFADNEIIASEPISYTYRRTDVYITRYCSLLGMNDPICLYLGNYDRYCTLTGKWTEIYCRKEDKGNYLKIELSDLNNIPTIGANGFLIRREMLKNYLNKDYLFDIDIICDLLKTNSLIKIAKVKIGIIHLYCKNIKDFVKKQKRRVRDYLYYKKMGLRKYPWNKTKRKKIIKFCLFTLLIIPVFFQAFRGWFKVRDRAWFFHVIACWMTLLVYGINVIVGLITNISIESRRKW